MNENLWRYLSFEENEKDNPWLDLARAIAIILVFLRHGQVFVDGSLSNTIPLLGTIFLNGWIGVDLFFVLSGYLIAKHLLRYDIKNFGFNIGQYLCARALRIAPAYFAVLFLIVAGAFPYYFVSDNDIFARVLIHVAFIQDYAGANLNFLTLQTTASTL